MIKEVNLDLTPFEEKIALHTYLKNTLDFPFYYGANLDALNDELTSVFYPLKITLRYPARPKGMMKEYLPRVLQVFRDASRENYNLELIIEEPVKRSCRCKVSETVAKENE